MSYFYFDTIDNFNLSSSHYGWILGKDKIIEKYKVFNEKDSINSLSNIEGGVYTLIKKDNFSIKITQDFQGSRKLFYCMIPYEKGLCINIIDNYYNKNNFKYNGILAISDSFLLLKENVEKLINKYCIDFKLTINELYMYSFVCCKEIPPIIEDTLIDQIHTMPINSEIIINGSNIYINKDNKHYIDNYYTIYPLSEEGMNIIDTWFNKWTDIISDLLSQYAHIVDLSGGLDTRIIFSMINHTNYFLHDINFYTSGNFYKKGELDIIVPELIYKDYIPHKSQNGEILNKFKENYTYLSNEEFYNIWKYNSLGTSSYTKNFSFMLNNSVELKFSGLFSNIKGLWDNDYSELINKFIYNLNNLNIDESLKNKIRGYIISNLNKIIEEPVYNKNHTSTYVYKRINNNIRDAYKIKDITFKHTICPFTDPILSQLDMNPWKNTNDSDNSLIATYIFYKYDPKLLEYEIQGDRKFKETTLNKLKDLNILQKFYSPKFVHPKYEGDIDKIHCKDLLEGILREKVKLGYEKLDKIYPELVEYLKNRKEKFNFNSGTCYDYIILALLEILNT